MTPVAFRIHEVARGLLQATEGHAVVVQPHQLGGDAFDRPGLAPELAAEDAVEKALEAAQELYTNKETCPCCKTVFSGCLRVRDLRPVPNLVHTQEA